MKHFSGLFYFRDNITYPVIIGLKTSHFAIDFEYGTNGKAIHIENILNGDCHGVKWSVDTGEIITLFEKDVKIMAYPSPCMNYIVAIYDGNSKRFPPPNNAVVYNLDGSIHKVITTPLLTIPDKNALKKGHSFETVFWDRNKENKLALCISVMEDEHSWVDWYQDIEFDAETGEFGDSLSRIGR